MIIAIIITAWIACGFIVGGLNFAYFEKKYFMLFHTDSNKKDSWVMVLGGPIALAVWIVCVMNWKLQDEKVWFGWEKFW